MFSWGVFVLIVENLNTLNLPNELMLCHHQEEGAGEDLDRVYDPMIFFVRENRTQADHHLCTWMTLLQLKVKRWSLKMEYPHPNGHSKYHRRFLLVVDFQAIEEDGVLFTVKIDFSHRLPQKVITYVCFLVNSDFQPVCYNMQYLPWLEWLSVLSTCLGTKGSLVQFLV